MVRRITHETAFREVMTILQRNAVRIFCSPREAPWSAAVVRRFPVRTACAAALFLCLAGARFASAADSGAELAGKLRAKQSGSTFARIRMQVASGQTLQLQIKSRVSDASGDIVYQILFPKERKGESVLLHRSGQKFSGTFFTPPNTLKPVGRGEIKQSLFGSELSCEDIIDNPFAWSQQAIVGTEDLDGTPCQILESKPGKDHG